MLFFLLLINVMFIDLNCFSQVSDVAHGPLVFCVFPIIESGGYLIKPLYKKKRGGPGSAVNSHIFHM